ncbi:MAG: glycosyltransferase family 4 protein [Actinomycetota bacterium]|nr:glycosyltransferase family 4 protein [Actinomycetota bacterium]
MNLVQALLRVDQRNRYRLLCRPNNVEMFGAHVDGASGSEVVTVRLPLPGPVSRIFYDQLVVGPSVARSSDVLLVPSHVGSLLAPIPQVVIFQSQLTLPSVRRDIPVPIRQPSIPRRIYEEFVLPRSLERAERVVAISNFIAERLKRDYRVAPEKLAVIHEGVDVRAFRHDQPPNPQAAPYLLFVGTLFPFKNVPTLMRAFAHLRSERRVPNELRLKIAGKDPTGHEQAALRELARALEVSEVTDFLGRVRDDDLPDLYGGAIALIHPSYVEGFGLTPLEAMAARTPVIASNAGALPEVVGDAGLLFDPHDEHGLADLIERVVREPALRRSFLERGERRAQEFTWDRTAQQFVSLFEDIDREGGEADAR